MERVELQAESRAVRGKQVRRLRAIDLIPGVVYGPDMEPRSIQIQGRLLSSTLQDAGSTTLIDLRVGEGTAPVTVLAREIQRDSLTGRLEHVDFYQVRLTEKVRTSPRIEFVGEPRLVREGTAVLIEGMKELEVECLPTDLIHSIEVDVSRLESFSDNILVGDLSVPAGVTIIADPSEIVAGLVPTRAAVEELEAEAEALAEAAVFEEEATKEG